MLHLVMRKILFHLKPSVHQWALIVIFLMTLPFVNPSVLGDGVGTYAYVRALLVEHHLSFENDWRAAPPSFRFYGVRSDGQIGPWSYTNTGHLPDRLAVGASMLWAPFLAPVHGVMLILRQLGFNARADGFSEPYVVTMALATALYGFAGLWIAFHFAKLFIAEQWSFLATLGIWFASSFPVYLYFEPAYSHVQSAFAVALFLWCWHRTRPQRTTAQWAILGLLSGLMLDLYYLNISILLLPLLESLRRYWWGWRAPKHDWHGLQRLFLANIIYSCVTLVVFLPTLITRQIIYGHPLDFGYDPSSWTHPAIWQPLLSSNHGLLSWTPIVVPSLVGLFLLRRYDRELATYSLAAFVAMYYIVACHPDWHGVSSFGNRFFISLTPLFILGLGVFLQEASLGFNRARVAFATSALIVGALILWNLAFIFQWGTGLVPHRGPISWRQMAYNQVAVVPARLGGALKSYFTNRSEMMRRIELEDVQRLRNE
jgi:hypothetical protein